MERNPLDRAVLETLGISDNLEELKEVISTMLELRDESGGEPKQDQPFFPFQQFIVQFEVVVIGFGRSYTVNGLWPTNSMNSSSLIHGVYPKFSRWSKLAAGSL